MIVGLDAVASATYLGSMGIDVTQPGYHRVTTRPTRRRTYPAEVLTPNEVLALLAQCSQKSSLGLRHRALITVLYRTGVRCSEALALLPKDVDLRGGSVAVLHGKGNRRWTVGIDPGVLSSRRGSNVSVS